MLEVKSQTSKISGKFKDKMKQGSPASGARPAASSPGGLAGLEVFKVLFYNGYLTV